MNGTASAQLRSKRKQYPDEEADRPPKQHRAVNGQEFVEDNTPDTSSIREDDDLELDIDVDETRVVPGLADTAEWQAAIEKVVRNVVSIRFCQTCSFDTDPALTSEATGFVVDAERG
jgi:pro-apoptotic serine protease NMA111